jgi:hypothetical protein
MGSSLASFASRPAVQIRQEPLGEDPIHKDQMYQELDQIVVTFNDHAQRLDFDDPESVGRFNLFIADSLATHWDTRDMAIRLLGIDDFAKLNRVEQDQICLALETTFHRYAYEVVEEYRQKPMELMESLAIDDETGLWRSKIRAKSRILPALTGDVYLKATRHGWAIVDAGYAGFTYVSMKDGSYRRTFDRGGVVGLLGWLDEKNVSYFADYCRPEFAEVMPRPVINLCLTQL